MLRCQFPCHVLKALSLVKIALKLSDFCKKMQNFRALGTPPLDPQNNPSHCEFLAIRLIIADALLSIFLSIIAFTTLFAYILSISRIFILHFCSY